MSGSGLEGKMFAGFEVLEKLAQGGMGAVYKARQVTLNRVVALKVMADTLAQDADYVRRFQREARSAAHIEHPNAVRIYSFGEVDGTHYIAMEYVEGETLRRRIERAGRLDPIDALLITEQIAQALGHAWDRAQLIHRDIKPDNIFLTHDGGAKLGDLGLAKTIGAASTGLTATGAMMGSPHYMSPEQARGDADADFRSDIYSLGCTLYHMLTGRTPYEADNVVALIHMQVYGAPPAIFKAWPECPTRVGMLVGRMLSKKREQRPGNYGDLINELEALRFWLEERHAHATAQPAQGNANLAQSPRAQPPAAPSAPESTGPDWALLGKVALVALLLAGGLAWLVAGRRGTRSRPAEPEARATTATDPLASATKDQPFVNSLGMKFVRVHGTHVLFSVWETRVRDWETFLKSSKYNWNQKVGFAQTRDHPVVRVSWNDAKAFCDWLSRKEDRSYRLPTDEEWSVAAGPGRYPWGDTWPPPADAGNFAGEESVLGKGDDPKGALAGWKDPHPRTAAAGSYRANGLGLHDLAGNVRTWCEDWYTAAIYAKHRAAGNPEHPPHVQAEFRKGNLRRVLRGGSWIIGLGANLQSSYRHFGPPDTRGIGSGFRCVLVSGP